MNELKEKKIFEVVNVVDESPKEKKFYTCIIQVGKSNPSVNSYWDGKEFMHDATYWLREITAIVMSKEELVELLESCFENGWEWSTENSFRSYHPSEQEDQCRFSEFLISKGLEPIK